MVPYVPIEGLCQREIADPSLARMFGHGPPQDRFDKGASLCSGPAFGTYVGRINPNSLLAELALPCQRQEDWDYEQCYSYYANGCYNTCQFVKFGDIEDFM